MNLAQPLIDGLSVASILLIAAIGFAITFGVMKVINMAHGELIVIGAYTTYLLTTVAGLSFFLSIIASFFVAALVGILIERIVIKHLYGRPLETLLATVGISIVLQQVIKMIFGSGGKSVANPISSSLIVADTVLPYFRLFIIGFSIILIAVTVWMMYKTKYGMQLRTVSQNRDMSEILGINTSRIDVLTFAFGSGLAGVAGAILAPIKSITPTMGAEYLMDSFMVVVLGGVGSIAGSAFGALLIGESKQIISIYSTEVLASILVFVFVIVVLRFRPQGLFVKERR